MAAEAEMDSKAAPREAQEAVHAATERQEEEEEASPCSRAGHSAAEEAARAVIVRQEEEEEELPCSRAARSVEVEVRPVAIEQRSVAVEADPVETVRRSADPGSVLVVRVECSRKEERAPGNSHDADHKDLLEYQDC